MRVWLRNVFAFNHVGSIFKLFGSLHHVIAKSCLMLQLKFGSLHLVVVYGWNKTWFGVVWCAVWFHFHLYVVLSLVPSFVVSPVLLICGRFPARFMVGVTREVWWEAWLTNCTSLTALHVVLRQVVGSSWPNDSRRRRLCLGLFFWLINFKLD